MKRNRTIDVFRTIAILSVLIYHFYVLCNYPYAEYKLLNRIISTGGETGVTLFFIISGFGIFVSLQRMDTDGSLTYRSFLKKRFLRILPQYYLGLGVLLLITSNAQYLNRKGLFDIITHAIFLHNWFPSTHGSINGVLWSLGTIFQFYFIALFIYKLIKKSNGILVYICSISLVIILKYFIYHYVFKYFAIEPSYYFIYGRQIYTALDNFIAGMIIADLLINKKFDNIKSKIYGTVFIASSIFAVFWLWQTETKSPYVDSLFGYSWHSVLCIILSVIIFSACNIKFNFKGIISRICFIIAKYQYGTYIWHFVIASTLISSSSWFNKISGSHFIVFTVIMLGICNVAGYFSTIVLEGIDYVKALKGLKEQLLHE